MFVLACGAGPSTRRKPPAKLQVIAKPDTAVVYVDERFFAPARKLAERPGPLRQGKHRVTIKAADHFPHDLELDFPAGVTKVEIALRPVPQ